MDEMENIDYLNEYLVKAFNLAIVEVEISDLKVDLDPATESKMIGKFAKEALLFFYDELKKDHGDNLQTLINIADWFYKMAIQQRNNYVQLVHDEGVANFTDYDIDTVKEFSLSEIGRTSLLTQFIMTALDLEYFLKLIKQYDFPFYPNDLIKINSILWFKEVLTIYGKRKKISISLLDEAYKALHMAASYDEFTDGQAYQKKNQAKKAIAIKLKNDPKQMALKEIEKEYLISKYPFAKRGYRAKFCKEMIKKFSVIEDIKTIERLFDRLNKSPLNS